MLNEGEMVYLVCVDPKKNSNKYYKMENVGGELVCTYGRVKEPNFQTKKYPLQKFNSLLRSKVNRSKNPYVDQTHLFVSDNDAQTPKTVYQHSSTPEANTFLKFLQAKARTTAQTALSVEVDTITPKQVETSTEQLEIIVEALKVSFEDANEELVKQFAIIPRFIDRRRGVASKLFIGEKKHDDEILEKEFELLDQLKTLVEKPKNVGKILTLPFELEVCSDADILQMFYDGLVDQYQNTKIRSVFKVHHEIASKKFKDLGNKQLLWHGSSTANWNSILNHHLQIRPPGIPTTGSNFGNGLYFAEISQKSLGYSSLTGSYWARGNDTSGVLALYEVSLGNTLHNKSASSSQNIEYALREGYDSVWCYSRKKSDTSWLYNDEIIVGDGTQSNIKYIFEVG